METYAVSALPVALAEMGDRTQLLTVMLASRYRRPFPILLGILVATIANHSLAALAGFYLSSILQAAWFRYAVSASFIAMALWAVVPDKKDDEAGPRRWRMGVFLTTVVSFFLVEIGDKTQVATVALAARYHDVLTVAAGTTTGMMLANIPAVFLGHAVTRVLPINALRIAAEGALPDPRRGRRGDDRGMGQVAGRLSSPPINRHGRPSVPAIHEHPANHGRAPARPLDPSCAWVAGTDARR